MNFTATTMNNNSKSTPKEQEEDRGLRGTWPWFAVNVLLFPAPAHMTLLRVKEFTLTRSLLHLGVTCSLFLVLIVSAALQVAVPDGGRLWMLLPIISGLVVLVANRSLISAFKPFSLTAVARQYWLTLLVLLGFLVLIHILPSLDLIAGNEADKTLFKSRFEHLPLWQETVILLISTLLLLVGYVTNTSSPFSINRIIILYTCFLLILSQLYWVLEFAFRWLSITGGIASLSALTLLAAILALDYYDAASFGQYPRRYFLLTWSKALSFIILWLCFFGLPQKVASLYVSYAYNQEKPLPPLVPSRHLVFTDQDRFKSAHEAHRRIRHLYSQGFLSAQAKKPNAAVGLVAEANGRILASDSDVCRLQSVVNAKQFRTTTLPLESLPFFRPVHREWDVLLSALVLQKDLSVSDLDQSIAGFKRSLPKASQGKLPNLKTPYDAHYVALATGMQVDFVPPNFELINILYANDFIPVLSLRLAGKDYWSALVSMDQDQGIAWFRLENIRKQEQSIRLLFDVNESAGRRTEIFSSQFVPLSLAYFAEMVAHNGAPVIVFSKEGLSSRMPDLFPANSQEELGKAIARIGLRGEVLQWIPAADPQEPITAYSNYVSAVSFLKSLLQPTRFAADTFLDPNHQPIQAEGRERLHQFTQVLDRMGTLRDTDRMDLAYKLVINDHAQADPDLFVRLAGTLPASSDLVDCRDAFVIGRRLFLLGHHREALGYLKIAFLRHPFSAEYETWYHIALIKLKKTPPHRYAPASREPELQLYYQTIADIENGKAATALKRLEAALAKDSHNSLLNHLLHKYFQRPLNDSHFFPDQEGL